MMNIAQSIQSEQFSLLCLGSSIIAHKSATMLGQLLLKASGYCGVVLKQLLVPCRVLSLQILCLPNSKKKRRSAVVQNPTFLSTVASGQSKADESLTGPVYYSQNSSLLGIHVPHLFRAVPCMI